MGKQVTGATPTIRDVAELAGVSIGTASKALNGKGQLKPETRLRVESAAISLGFQPNELVRSLLRGRTYTVGLLADDMDGRFSTPLLAGIEDTLTDAEISVLLSVSRENIELERRHIASLLAKQVDGIIVCGARGDPRPPIELGNRAIPVVYAYCRPQDPADHGFVVDNADGARKATEHLIGLGRTKIAHIAGPYSWRDQQIRLQSFISTMHDHRLPLLANGVIGGGNWTAPWGREATHRLLDLHPEIDAIFCGCDTIALGTIDALKERGRRVPEDVAIVGFDNWDAIALSTNPQLTTIDMNFHELGVRAGRALLEMIDRGADAVPAGAIELPCTLVVRESSGVPVPTP
jgi:LacI family transcriptional regulator